MRVRYVPAIVLAAGLALLAALYWRATPTDGNVPRRIPGAHGQRISVPLERCGQETCVRGTVDGAPALLVIDSASPSDWYLGTPAPPGPRAAALAHDRHLRFATVRIGSFVRSAVLRGPSTPPREATPAKWRLGGAFFEGICPLERVRIALDSLAGSFLIDADPQRPLFWPGGSGKVIPLFSNPHGQYRVYLRAGAERVPAVLDTAWAQGLVLPPGVSATVRGPAVTGPGASRVHASGLSGAMVEFVVPATMRRRGRQPILGLGALASYRVTIDYRDRLLYLEASALRSPRVDERSGRARVTGAKAQAIHG